MAKCVRCHLYFKGMPDRYLSSSRTGCSSTCASVVLEYEQVLTVRVNSERPRIEFSNSNSPDAVQLRCMTSQISGRLPQLGVSLGDLDISPVSDVIPLIAELKGVLHFPLDCLSPKLNTQAEFAGSIALQTERPVYLTLRNVSDEIVPEIVSLLCQWVKQGVVIQQLDILDGTHPGLTWLRACAREARLSVPCGKVVASFKDRAGLLEAANSGADFLAWRGTPRSHQEDDETLLENADVFLFQAVTARCFEPQAQLTVGPIRFDRTQRDSCSLPDPRYRGILAASFVASSLQALAEGQVDLAVFFDAIGPTGHVYASSSSPQPGFDGNPHPQVFPSYYVLRELRSFSGSATFQVESSDRLRVKAFGVCHRNG